MSKSLKRVTDGAGGGRAAGEVVETGGRNAHRPQAAAAAGCAMDQIVKSIAVRGAASGQLYCS